MKDNNKIRTETEWNLDKKKDTKVRDIIIVSILLLLICGGAYIAIYISDFSNMGIIPLYSKKLTIEEEISSKIVTNDEYLRNYACRITNNCQSGSKACQTAAIYYYLTDNFKYYADPVDTNVVQSPYETIKNSGGDCEDLTILFMSLLENIGIKTYLVFTEGHVCCVVESENTEILKQYLYENEMNEWVEAHNKENSDSHAVIESGKAYSIYTQSETKLLKGGYYFYRGYDGTQIVYPNISFTCKFQVSSNQPISVCLVSNYTDAVNYATGGRYYYYGKCCYESVFKANGQCTIDQGGAVVIYNKNKESAIITYRIEYLWQYSKDEITKNIHLRYFSIDGKTYVLFETTRRNWDKDISGGYIYDFRINEIILSIE